MKKCPFCAEEIQDEAIKCRHCGEFLDGRRAPNPSLPWHFRTSAIVIAVCCVGPLALPMIWWRPRTTPAWKVGLTIAILGLTWALTAAALKSVDLMMKQYEQLMGTY